MSVCILSKMGHASVTRNTTYNHTISNNLGCIEVFWWLTLKRKFPLSWTCSDNLQNALGKEKKIIHQKLEINVWSHQICDFLSTEKWIQSQGRCKSTVTAYSFCTLWLWYEMYSAEHLPVTKDGPNLHCHKILVNSSKPHPTPTDIQRLLKC